MNRQLHLCVKQLQTALLSNVELRKIDSNEVARANATSEIMAHCLRSHVKLRLVTQLVE